MSEFAKGFVSAFPSWHFIGYMVGVVLFMELIALTLFGLVKILIAQCAEEKQ